MTLVRAARPWLALGCAALASYGRPEVARADPPAAPAPTRRPPRRRVATLRFVVETGTESLDVGLGRAPGSLVFMRDTAIAWTLRVGARLSLLRLFQISLRAGFSAPFALGLNAPPDSCGPGTTIGTQPDRGGTAYDFHGELELRFRFVPGSPFYVGGGARVDALHLDADNVQTFPCDLGFGGAPRPVTIRTVDEVRTRAGGIVALGLLLGRRDQFDLRVGAAFQGEATSLDVTLGWAPW